MSSETAYHNVHDGTPVSRQRFEAPTVTTLEEITAAMVARAQSPFQVVVCPCGALRGNYEPGSLGQTEDGVDYDFEVHVHESHDDPVYIFVTAEEAAEGLVRYAGHADHDAGCDGALRHYGR